MTFEINGSKGIYDGKIEDASVRYGRNAAANHRGLIVSTINSAMNGETPILDFMPNEKALNNNLQKMDVFVKENANYLNNMPSLDYEYRYMPEVRDKVVDKKALFGAAYEEMGASAIPIADFEKNVLPGKEYTMKPLDLNKDGVIDVSEYSASILAADILSKQNPSISNIDGKMNAKGMNAVIEYARISNAEAATKLYSKIYSTYTLNELA